MSKSGTTLQIQTTVLFIAIITLLGLIPAEAQFVDFGRNKVQYSDFKWNTLETEHFVIYYYEGAQELAEHGAFFAEEAYADHQQNFKHSLTHKVPLIFY